ncbi:MAG: hypothetical protein KGI00_02615 [Candidatus Micrarchaeota archaeon]|nr:hypothetical protein [Candidatus Micrarchaeota archaeon]
MTLKESELGRIDRGIEKFVSRLKKESPTNYIHVKDYIAFLQANNKHTRTVYRHALLYLSSSGSTTRMQRKQQKRS